MLPFVPVGLLLAATLTVDRTIPDDPGADPLAPAQTGSVQCYDPDAASHSCRLIAAYRHARDGTWTKLATIMPDPGQHLTVEIESPVSIRNGEVCGTFRREQVLAAKLLFFDRPVPVDQSIPLLSQIADAMSAAFDREICTRFLSAGGVLIGRPHMTGVAAPFPDQRVIWVRPDSGYRVQPRNGNGK